jgi:hypothetical protein
MQVKEKFPKSDAEPFLTMDDGNCGFDATTNACNTFIASCPPSDYAAADLKLDRDGTNITVDHLRQLVFNTSSITDGHYVDIIAAMKETITDKRTGNSIELVHEGEWLLSMNLYMKASIHIAILPLGFLVMWRRK